MNYYPDPYAQAYGGFADPYAQSADPKEAKRMAKEQKREEKRILKEAKQAAKADGFGLYKQQGYNAFGGGYGGYGY